MTIFDIDDIPIDYDFNGKHLLIHDLQEPEETSTKKAPVENLRDYMQNNLSFPTAGWDNILAQNQQQTTNRTIDTNGYEIEFLAYNFKVSDSSGNNLFKVDSMGRKIELGDNNFAGYQTQFSVDDNVGVIKAKANAGIAISSNGSYVYLKSDNIQSNTNLQMPYANNKTLVASINNIYADVYGNISFPSNGIIQSEGNYTPTITSNNTGAIVPGYIYQLHYVRTGNMVTVTGMLEVMKKSNANSSNDYLIVSVPINAVNPINVSNFIGGGFAAFSTSYGYLTIRNNNATDTFRLYCNTGSLNSTTLYNIFFTYTINN